MSLVRDATTPEGSLSSYRMASKASVTVSRVMMTGGALSLASAGSGAVVDIITAVAVAMDCSKKLRRVVAERDDDVIVMAPLLLLVRVGVQERQRVEGATKPLYGVGAKMSIIDSNEALKAVILCWVMVI
mmetsp:Transcript_7162/g.16305  ORF Transcript_7162/g.16305 Transcript_7162/m.16305 type:complete len:130 (-) Transcript_7162:51-440(-)